MLLHGGYWMPGYHLDQLDPMADVMTRAGWATWNVEYRPIGDGSAWPDPMSDVALAVDRLEQEDLAEKVVLLGHSAGGHLAVWAASRTERTPGGRPRVRPVGAISLSGVLDLTLAATAPGSGPPVTAFADGSPAEQPEHYAVSDPTLLVPAACPVWAVHAEDDMVIPSEQGTSYVDRAVAAGGQAEVVDVPGDHFTLIDPRGPLVRHDQEAGHPRRRLIRRSPLPVRLAGVSSPAVSAPSVRTITAEEHLAFIRSVTDGAGGSASFLQTPAWAAVKPEWKPESIGWFRGDEIVGAALVLYRQLPRVKRYLAYLPEGPLLDWSSENLRAWLDPMAAHLKRQGAFGIRIGPPVVTRRWSAAQVKEGIADESVHSLTAVPPHGAQPGRRQRRLPAPRGRLAAPVGGRRLRGRAAAVQLPDPARRRRGEPAQRGQTSSRA